jgi:4-hydroxy-tetrahydrodipicolinate synthase
VQITVEQANGRVPVFAGVTTYSQAMAIEAATAAVDVGAASLMVLLPFYYQPTIASAMNFIRRVSEAVSRPVMVYNNPWFAGIELSPAQIKELADEGFVNSIKAAHGDPMRVSYTKYLCGDTVSVLYGHDYAPLEAFAIGADGWLSGFPNIVPDLAVRLLDEITVQKDLDAGRATWAKIAPLAYYFMFERKGTPPAPHWLAVIKQALTLRGIDVGLPRLPAEPMSEEEVARLVAAMAEIPKPAVGMPKPTR